MCGTRLQDIWRSDLEKILPSVDKKTIDELFEKILKPADELLKCTADLNRGGLIIINKDYRIILANGMAAAHFEKFYKSEEEILGEDWRTLFYGYHPGPEKNSLPESWQDSAVRKVIEEGQQRERSLELARNHRYYAVLAVRIPNTDRVVVFLEYIPLAPDNPPA